MLIWSWLFFLIFLAFAYLRATELSTRPFQMAFRQNSSTPTLFFYCCGNKLLQPYWVKTTQICSLLVWELYVKNEATGLHSFWRLQGRPSQLPEATYILWLGHLSSSSKPTGSIVCSHFFLSIPQLLVTHLSDSDSSCILLIKDPSDSIRLTG